MSLLLFFNTHDICWARDRGYYKKKFGVVLLCGKLGSCQTMIRQKTSHCQGRGQSLLGFALILVFHLIVDICKYSLKAS